MKYRVVWSPDAFARLLREWNAVGNPEEAIHAFDNIEELLSHHGDTAGESRDGDRRILLLSPLGVVFEEQAGQMVILDAWMTVRRKP